MSAKSLHPFETGALAAGVVAFIFSFFSRFRSVDLGIYGTYGINAWHSFSTLGMILIIIATAAVAVKAFAPTALPDGVPWNLIIMAVAGVGTLLVLLRAFTYEGGSTGWSGWITILAGIVLTVFSALSFRESDEKLPNIQQRS